MLRLTKSVLFTAAALTLPSFRYSFRSASKLPFNFSSNCRMSTGQSEVDAALINASTDPAINPKAPTFFDKLIKKEISANILFEDDLWYAVYTIM